MSGSEIDMLQGAALMGGLLAMVLYLALGLMFTKGGALVALLGLAGWSFSWAFGTPWWLVIVPCALCTIMIAASASNDA